MMLLLAIAGSARAAPPELGVRVVGTVPGFSAALLDTYLAQHMNAATDGTRHFAALDGTGDYIEWTFRTNPFAVGNVRTFGFSRAMMERLVGSHQTVSIEARLYLKGAYQSLVSGSSTVHAGPNDADFAAEIGTLSRLLMSNADMDAADTRPLPKNHRSASGS